MLKKSILILFFILIFSLSVNAIVVSDITSQISEGNEQIIQANAQNSAEISRLRDEITKLSASNTSLAEKMLTKNDLSEVYANFNDIQRGYLQMNLLTNLFLILFVVAGYGLAKGRKWV